MTKKELIDYIIETCCNTNRIDRVRALVSKSSGSCYYCDNNRIKEVKEVSIAGSAQKGLICVDCAHIETRVLYFLQQEFYELEQINFLSNSLCPICSKEHNSSPSNISFAPPIEHIDEIKQAKEQIELCATCSNSFEKHYSPDIQYITNYDEEKCEICWTYQPVTQLESSYRSQSPRSNFICPACINTHLSKNILFRKTFDKPTNFLSKRFFHETCNICNKTVMGDILKIPYGCDCVERVTVIGEYTIELQEKHSSSFLYHVKMSNVFVKAIMSTNQDTAYFNAIEYVKKSKEKDEQ